MFHPPYRSSCLLVQDPLCQKPRCELRSSSLLIPQRWRGRRVGGYWYAPPYCRQVWPASHRAHGWLGRSRIKGRSENCWRTGARNQAVLTIGTLVPEQPEEITAARAAESCDLASPHRSVKWLWKQPSRRQAKTNGSSLAPPPQARLEGGARTQWPTILFYLPPLLQGMNSKVIFPLWVKQEREKRHKGQPRWFHWPWLPSGMSCHGQANISLKE